MGQGIRGKSPALRVGIGNEIRQTCVTAKDVRSREKNLKLGCCWTCGRMGLCRGAKSWELRPCQGGPATGIAGCVSKSASGREEFESHAARVFAAGISSRLAAVVASCELRRGAVARRGWIRKGWKRVWEIAAEFGNGLSPKGDSSVARRVISFRIDGIRGAPTQSREEPGAWNAGGFRWNVPRVWGHGGSDDGKKKSVPEQVRTADLRFRKPPLYPTELRGRGVGGMQIATMDVDHSSRISQRPSSHRTPFRPGAAVGEV